eukprot:m.48011 g.48011  ORF g.48011 m.48011 type:complete len:677 (-) comp12369_c0_seq2:92-2122(-)
MQPEMLKFATFSSSADTAFWQTLNHHKLTSYKLSSDAQPIFASYASGYRNDLPLRVSVSAESFETEPAAARIGQVYLLRGSLYTLNTLEQFKKADISAFAQTTIAEIATAITSGDALKDHTLINRFILLAFPDLKAYHYYYWFAFPALTPAAAVPDLGISAIADVIPEHQWDTISEGVAALRDTDACMSFFIVQTPTAGAEAKPAVLPLSALTPAMFDDKSIFFGFADPCGMETYPGWPLRNFLALLSHHGGANKEIRVLCFRHRTLAGVTDISFSRIISTRLPEFDFSSPDQCSHVKGLEKTAKGRLGPRFCNLSGSMDPSRLAETAVDLNLKLMRWRLMPDVQLEQISQTRCLLLGAGTLGCNVARALLGWGVRHITFVDSGRVSYSNPVRQTLFQFEDCLDGGKPKAEAAAMRLHQIFPNITTRGVVLSIPMAGHPVSDEAFPQTMSNARQLEQLIKEHDVVFLLMDSRESRWLPTVLAASEHKLCLTAALGFDTFVAMRHGMRIENEDGDATTTAGCYFCNDGTAPQNSARDRTLDQQCTVSRPGISFLASAMVVELMINVLHHPEGVHAGIADPSNMDASVMGAVPQQIRGSLAGFSNLLLAGEPYKHCTACSSKVVETWRTNPETLVREALNSPQYLEDLTGITEIKAMVQDMADLDIDFTDEEDVDEAV